MFKKIYLKNIIFLIFLMFAVLALISTSSACLFEETKKIDSGKKIIIVKNEQYQIKWESKKVIGHDKKYVSISYKSMKNKKNKGSSYITLQKTGKNKMNVEEHSSPMRVPNYKVIKTKVKTDDYYWKKIRPQINKFAKNSIFNKETLKYNGTIFVNRSNTHSVNNDTLIDCYNMKWEVYYYSKTSSIEILKRYNDLNEHEKNDDKFSNLNIRIDIYNNEKLRITTYSYCHYVRNGTTNLDIYRKYVKTNLTPKQYYLQVYKIKA